MTTTAMLDNTLWAVSIHGPDDLIPVADYLTALRFANRFNEWWQQQKTAKPLHPYDPRMWAVPVEWAGDADRHAEWVKTPSPDYAPFLSAPLSHAAGDVVGVVTFLNEAATYFQKRDSKGEDLAVWSNVYNAENCRKAATTFLALSANAEAAEARVKEMEAALEPFAAFADALSENVPDAIAIGIYADGAMRFGPSGGANVGSLRAARSLSPIKEAGNV